MIRMGHGMQCVLPAVAGTIVDIRSASQNPQAFRHFFRRGMYRNISRLRKVETGYGCGYMEDYRKVPERIINDWIRIQYYHTAL